MWVYYKPLDAHYKSRYDMIVWETSYTYESVGITTQYYTCNLVKKYSKVSSHRVIGSEPTTINRVWSDLHATIEKLLTKFPKYNNLPELGIFLLLQAIAWKTGRVQWFYEPSLLWITLNKQNSRHMMSTVNLLNIISFNSIALTVLMTASLQNCFARSSQIRYYM